MKSLFKSWNVALDKLALFDWPRLIPSVKVFKFDEFAFGIEPTWGNSGAGIGVGLGKVDFWMGWPAVGA